MSKRTDASWETIERLAAGDETQRESALRRARFRVEQFLKEHGYVPKKGGVVEQVRRFAAGQDLDLREVRGVLQALRYRNDMEHESYEAGVIGTRTAIATLRRFCESGVPPAATTTESLPPVSLVTLLAELVSELPTECRTFQDYYERELTHHEKRRLDAGCKERRITAKELRYILMQPIGSWRAALVTALGTTGPPQAIEATLTSFVEGLLHDSSGQGPESRAFSEASHAIQKWAPKKVEEINERRRRRKEEWAKEDALRLAKQRARGRAFLIVAVLAAMVAAAIYYAR